MKLGGGWGSLYLQDMSTGLDDLEDTMSSLDLLLPGGLDTSGWKEISDKMFER